MGCVVPLPPPEPNTSAFKAKVALAAIKGEKTLSELAQLFADAGYQGPQFQKALAKIMPHLETEIVKRSDQAKGFVQLPKRWIVDARTMSTG